MNKYLISGSYKCYHEKKRGRDSNRALGHLTWSAKTFVEITFECRPDKVRSKPGEHTEG